MPLVGSINLICVTSTQMGLTTIQNVSETRNGRASEFFVTNANPE
jgi:hypothetical protein